MSSSKSGTGEPNSLPPVDLKPLLTKLWPVNSHVPAEEIAEAISHFFTNQVTEAQTAALLMALHFTEMDLRADVLQKTASVMLEAAEDIPVNDLNAVLAKRAKKEGTYNGGLVRIKKEKAHFFPRVYRQHRIERYSCLCARQLLTLLSRLAKKQKQNKNSATL